MKKKLFIGTVLPTIAALGVIGSGFSLWIFSDSNSVTKPGSVGVTVTNVLDLKDNTVITVTNENGALELDQTKSTTNPQGKGANWSTVQSATFKSNAAMGADYEVVWGEKVKITFTTTITVPQAVASHIELSSAVYTTGWSSTTDASDNTVYTYTFDTTSLNTSSWTATSIPETTIFDFANVTVSYVSEPTALSDYQTMRTDCNDKTISVSYLAKATITE